MCAKRAVQRWCGLFSLCVLIGVTAPSATEAQESWKWTDGGTEPGKVIVGFRAGFSVLTQELRSNTDTDVGSVVNLQGMYSLTKWLSAGLTLEWERRAVDLERPSVAFGHLDTVSVLPTVELRPTKYGPIAPYLSMGFGVNVNSFGESTGNRVSPSNTFAWRLAWGGDYFVTSKVALNTEMAYKRNDGHVTIDGRRSDDWNASSFNFLFGVRAFF